MNRRPSLLLRRYVVNLSTAALLGSMAGLSGFALDRNKGLTIVTALADEAVTTSGNTAPEPTAPQPPMPAPRDPEIAVREQYDAAISEGTVAALDLFVQRYPGHPLAAATEDEIRRLKGEGKTP